jgi:predicted DNA-binding protein with PD1-like motif
MEHILDSPHEVTGTGTIFPDENQNPILHMHIACGRRSSTITGCVRNGVKIWNVMEIMLIELVGTQAKRVVDSKTGFKLLEP